MLKQSSLILFISLAFIGCKDPASMKPKDGPAQVTTTKPFQKEYIAETTFNGVVESPRIIQIKNRTEGFIEKQYYKDGSYVKQNQPLYKIDSKPLQTELEYAKAQFNSLKIEIDNLNNILTKTELSFKSGGASKQEYETAKSNFEKAKANLNMLQASINKIKLNISYTTIVSPVNGFIEKSQQNQGSFVNVSTQFLTNIYTTDKLHFTVMLPIDNKTKNTKVSINNEEYNATLDFCDPMTEQSSGLVKCRYEFKANKQIEINSLGKIILKQAATGLFIPQSALIQNNNGKSVYIFNKDKAIATPIKTGSWDKKDIQVLSGINKSDEIIINGIANIKDNGKVTKETK